MRLYSIKDISKRLNVPRSTIRYWEKELNGICTSIRTKGGQRRYTEKHITVFRTVLRLKRRGFQLREIEQKLIENGIHDNGGFETINVTAFAEYVAEAVKKEILRLLA